MSLPLDVSDAKREPPSAEQQSGETVGRQTAGESMSPVESGQLESGTGEKPSVENAKTGEALRSFTLKVMYLFAGAERKTSVVSYLKSMAAKRAGLWMHWKWTSNEVIISISHRKGCKIL